MAKKFTYGLASLKFGTPTGLATMPTTLNEVGWSKEGSVNINIPEPDKQEIPIEESDTPLKVLWGTRGITIEAETYDTSLENLALMFGGSVASAKWTPDTTISAEDQAIEIVTRPDDSKAKKISIPKASIMATMSGSLTKKDGLTIKYVITPLIVDAAQAPWWWEEV